MPYYLLQAFTGNMTDFQPVSYLFILFNGICVQKCMKESSKLSYSKRVLAGYTEQMTAINVQNVDKKLRT
jgi:hypothetical protein